MRTGRNEPCPCGSGKKFKHCCEEKMARPASKGMILLGAALAALAVVGLIPIFGDKTPAPRAAATAPASTPAAAVPATTAAAPAPAAQQQFTPGPQPPGAVPPGKVWSTEHGHWHDAQPAGTDSPIKIEAAPGVVATANPVGTPSTPPPPGPAPAGKVWSPQHGHWHDADPTTKPTSLGIVNPPGGAVTVPPGPAPAGKVWSAEHGHWHDAPKNP